LPNADAIGFGDAACTAPIASVSPCATVPRFVLGPERSLACGDTGRPVFAVDQPTADQAYYYTDATGCHLGINSTPNVLYALHEVAVDKFVAADLVHEGPGPLQVYAFHAEDGAIEATSTWDVARDAECHGLDFATTARCEPNEIALAYDTLWADPTCSIPAAVDLSRVRPCATPSAVLAYLDGDAREYHEIYDRIAGAYTSSAGTCSAASGLPGDVFYGQGPVIPTESFVQLDRVLDGTGRARAIRYEATPGTSLALASQFQDTTIGELCMPLRFTDGTTRCVTAYYATAQTTGGAYSDASCTQPLATMTTGTAAHAILVEHRDPRCEETEYEAFALGTPYTGAVYGGPACQPLDPTPFTTYLTIGDELDLPVLTER
ncbi:MAG: hypothetical protein ABI678_22955, partial [Kofleriaceae bacterium]